MAYLPLANIMHHKLRSALSALGIGIGICMLVTLSGLARGSVYEIAERWEATEKAVESILFRARRALRMKLLKTDLVDEAPPTRNGAPTTGAGQTSRVPATEAPPEERTNNILREKSGSSNDTLS